MKTATVLALHGGAGVNPGRDYAEVETHLRGLVEAGKQRLAEGASALDVVEWAVCELEASGLYVAGRGAAPNAGGVVEFDASIMDGSRLRAGAVSAIQDVVSPVSAARAVMELTPHVLLAGDGASRFAWDTGLERIGNRRDYFRMPVGVLQTDIDAETAALGHGTVGAVARDLDGRLASATSTGGTFGKRPGRVGDTPLIGIGTWADDAMAASCTGVGEYFILAGGAGDVAARMRYGGMPLDQACRAMLDRVADLGGDGGIIAIDARGQPSLAWNSPGLKRAVAGSHLPTMVGIA